MPWADQTVGDSFNAMIAGRHGMLSQQKLVKRRLDETEGFLWNPTWAKKAPVGKSVL